MLVALVFSVPGAAGKAERWRKRQKRREFHADEAAERRVSVLVKISFDGAPRVSGLDRISGSHHAHHVCGGNFVPSKINVSKCEQSDLNAQVYSK